MFDCGIKAILGEMQTKFEDDCISAVQSYGFEIDKEKLEKALTDSKSFYNEGYADAKRQYDRTKGHWIEQDPFQICNQCGKGYNKDFHKGYNFCPKCGADMREADNDK